MCAYVCLCVCNNIPVFCVIRVFLPCVLTYDWHVELWVWLYMLCLHPLLYLLDLYISTVELKYSIAQNGSFEQQHLDSGFSYMESHYVYVRVSWVWGFGEISHIHLGTCWDSLLEINTLLRSYCSVLITPFPLPSDFIFCPLITQSLDSHFSLLLTHKFQLS